MKNKYVFAKLSKLDCTGVRLGGAGLGNILFPWARSVVFANKHNLVLINTTWRSLKVGPIFRGELDTRGYSDIFKENNISGIKKFLLLLFGKRIKEKDIKYDQESYSIRPKILLFSGMKNQMKDIMYDHKIVKQELLNIITKNNMDSIKHFDGNGISIHIRMGDFYTPSSEVEIREGKTNCRLPINWYVSIIKKLRAHIGQEIKVNVFSDGTDKELQDIVNLSGVKRYYFGSAIADMIALSKSDILIASNSTFSLWASYLGQLPTIWFPGTHKINLFNTNKIYEGELDYNDEINPLLKKALFELFISHKDT